MSVRGVKETLPHTLRRKRSSTPRARKEISPTELDGADDKLAEKRNTFSHTFSLETDQFSCNERHCFWVDSRCLGSCGEDKEKRLAIFYWKNYALF
ncbi:hypothetical protein NPIL_115131 [Nephila pilipes]|uniref:Uncharacterized protein n=1 Tax=Nephila pilipes TaxID=299642 RepID=A0A8X6IC33_NEPPI|nr:hypothetical protein NPIL_115131 [Nephila pilipes]